MSSVDLYKVHDDLAQYFQTVLELNQIVTGSLKAQLQANEITIKEYITIMDRCMLPPPLLTAISSFLRNNDVRVTPDSLVEDVQNYEAALEERIAETKELTSLENLDPSVE